MIVHWRNQVGQASGLVDQPHAHHVRHHGHRWIAAFDARHGGLRDAQLSGPLRLRFTAAFSGRDDVFSEQPDLLDDGLRVVIRRCPLPFHSYILAKYE